MPGMVEQVLGERMTGKPKLSALNGHKILCLGKKNPNKRQQRAVTLPHQVCSHLFTAQLSNQSSKFSMIASEAGKKELPGADVEGIVSWGILDRIYSTLKASMWVCIPADAFEPGVSLLFIFSRSPSHRDIGAFRISPLLGTNLLNFPCGYNVNVKLKSYHPYPELTWCGSTAAKVQTHPHKRCLHRRGQEWGRAPPLLKPAVNISKEMPSCALWAASAEREESENLTMQPAGPVSSHVQ